MNKCEKEIVVIPLTSNIHMYITEQSELVLPHGGLRREGKTGVQGMEETR